MARALVVSSLAVALLLGAAGPSHAAKPKPKLSVTPAKVTEPPPGETAIAVFKVKLSRKHAKPVRFNYRTKPGTATAGADFVAKSGRKRIKAGRRATKVKVRVNGDELIEGTERFTLRIAKAKGAKLKRRSAIGRIADRAPEPAPEVDLDALELTPDCVAAGSTLQVGQVKLTGPASSATFVEVESSDEGVAIVEGGGATIPPGASSGPVTVSTVEIGSTTLTARLGATERTATLTVELTVEVCP